jgi:hypothetical protein
MSADTLEPDEYGEKQHRVTACQLNVDKAKYTVQEVEALILKEEQRHDYRMKALFRDLAIAKLEVAREESYLKWARTEAEKGY